MLPLPMVLEPMLDERPDDGYCGHQVRQTEIEKSNLRCSPVTSNDVCVCPHVHRLVFKTNESEGAEGASEARALGSRAKRGC
jgi:hypothetical protein